MSRLLHAAARGARIQLKINNEAAWEPVQSGYAPMFSTDFYRIHPDDEHLQYGPISSAIRRRAETGAVQAAGLPYLFGYFDLTEREWDTLKHSAGFDRVFFYLLVSEALADEGL